MKDEPTHMMLNGVRVDLTPEQIKETKKEWKRGRAQMKARKKEEVARSAKRLKLLERLGITEEEAQLLLSKG